MALCLEPNSEDQLRHPIFICLLDEFRGQFISYYEQFPSLTEIRHTITFVGAPWDRSHFPIPAAGMNDDIEEPGCAFDYVLLLYAPTIRARLRDMPLERPTQFRYKLCSDHHGLSPRSNRMI